MPKFVVSVPIEFRLEKVIEAKDEEEARKIAESLEPEDFENFHFFYEHLGDVWKDRKIEIERFGVPIEILDWWVDEDKTCHDKITGVSNGKKVIAGELKAFGISGKFKVVEEWGDGYSGTTVEVSGEFTEDEKAAIKEYIEEYLRETGETV